MLPLRDDIPSSRPPVITLTLIAANVLVFMYQLSLSVTGDPGSAQAAEQLVMDFGAVPCRLTGACRAGEFPSPVVSIFTSMFLHGGLLHVAGNMLYLWIFGDNVEDVLGHGRFIVLYLLSGVGAAWGQALLNPTSAVPMIGASGAISGVLGAYLLLFPYARVLTLITFGFFIRFVYIPAVVLLGFWIVLQFFAGLAAFGVTSAGGRDAGGVAWFAHVGGFIAGIVLLFVLRPRRGRRL